MIEDKDPKSIGTDKEQIGKLTSKLTELGLLRSQLPSAFKETATKLECFYKDILDHYTSISKALSKHASLVKAKEKVLIDLTSLQKRKLELAQFAIKTNTSLDKVEKKPKKLEEETTLLVKEEVELNAAKE